MVASRPVYAIVGSDRFLRAAALEELLKTLSKEADDLGPIRFQCKKRKKPKSEDEDSAGKGSEERVDEGYSDDRSNDEVLLGKAPSSLASNDVALAQVLDEVRTPSLLGGKRVVVVENADGFVTAYRKALERYVAEPSPDGCLVLLCDSMPQTTNLFKLIDKHGQVRKCEAPKGQALISWMMRRAVTTHGKRLPEPVARRLRELIGTELGWVDTELSKLAAYVGQRPEITLADVNAATGESREEKVFEVVNALADGNISLAIGAWQQVLATDRAASGRSLGGLAFKLRQYIEAHRRIAAGIPIERFAGNKNDEMFKYVFVDQLRRHLKALPARKLMAMQGSLVEADYAIKTGASTLEVAMEKFLVEYGTAPPLYAKAG